jgi:signal transduction histidine kinase
MAAVGLSVTLLVALVPALRFAYRAPGLQVVLETAEACVALLVAYLVGGRFREHRSLQELLLTCGLVVLAVTNLLLSAVPVALLLGSGEDFSRWAPLTVRLLGTALVAASALAPPEATVPPGRLQPALLAGTALLVLAGVAAATSTTGLPPVVDPELDLRDSSGVVIAGHPLALTVQVVAGLLFTTAAVAFTRQATAASDELFRWLGAGCALAAVARLDYLLFPSLYTEFVYIGDAFRLGFYLCLLLGAAREVRSYWARAAVLEDRRRLARDLHDGLTQELSFIYAQSQLLIKRPDDRRVPSQISAASARALDEARQAIGALTRPADQAFAETFRQSVEDLAGRYGIQTVAAIEDEVVVTSEQAEAIFRITAESLRNAVRHGQASCVSVGLTAEPLVLTVEDDGCGFHPDGVVSRGFGLTSMRERAEGTGASYALTSADGQGTKVRVSWG